MKRIIIYTVLQHVLCFFLFAQNNIHTSTRFAVKNPQEIFIGGILNANSLNDAEHKLLNVQLNPITISYSLPIKSETISPSYDNMIKAFKHNLLEDNLLKPNYQLTFTIKQISSYQQLYTYFGEEIDLSTFFRINSYNLASKTVAIVDINQSFFSVMMDLPEDLSKDPLVHEQMNELIYVSSIEFGRRAMLIIESDFNYQDIKASLDELLSNASNRETKISNKSKSLIANSIVRGLILDPLAKENTITNTPLESLINYINTEVTPENFGIPIYFTASWIKDNSVFTNKYSY